MPDIGATRAVPSAARCRGCGYALRGLSDHRCPECGRPFDPARRGTMRLPHHPPRLMRWLVRPQTRFGRSLPAVAVVAVAYGTYLPGWESRILIAGFVIISGCVLGTL